MNGKILDLVKILYGNTKSRVTVNNKVSEFFQVSKGVRQGEN